MVIIYLMTNGDYLMIQWYFFDDGPGGDYILDDCLMNEGIT